LPDLSENALNEVFGIGGLPGDKTAFSLPNLNVYGGKLMLANGDNSIDWNGNGTIDQNGVVWANINNFPQWSCPSAEGETLKGFNDWANLNFNFRSTSNFDEGLHLTDNVEDPSPTVALAMHETGQDTVIPEFPAWAMLSALTLVTLLAVMLLKKRKRIKDAA
jgi:hypothetical protein